MPPLRKLGLWRPLTVGTAALIAALVACVLWRAGSFAAIVLSVATLGAALAAGLSQLYARWARHRNRRAWARPETTEIRLKRLQVVARPGLVGRSLAIVAILLGAATVLVLALPGQMAMVPFLSAALTPVLLALGGMAATHKLAAAWALDAVVPEEHLRERLAEAAVWPRFVAAWSLPDRILALRQAAALHPATTAAGKALLLAQYAPSSVSLPRPELHKSLSDEIRLRLMGWRVIAAAAAFSGLLSLLVMLLLPQTSWDGIYPGFDLAALNAPESVTENPPPDQDEGEDPTSDENRSDGSPSGESGEGAEGSGKQSGGTGNEDSGGSLQSKGGAPSAEAGSDAAGPGGDAARSDGAEGAEGADRTTGNQGDPAGAVGDGGEGVDDGGSRSDAAGQEEGPGAGDAGSASGETAPAGDTRGQGEQNPDPGNDPGDGPGASEGAGRSAAEDTSSAGSGMARGAAPAGPGEDQDGASGESGDASESAPQGQGPQPGPALDQGESAAGGDPAAPVTDTQPGTQLATDPSAVQDDGTSRHPLPAGSPEPRLPPGGSAALAEPTPVGPEAEEAVEAAQEATAPDIRQAPALSAGLIARLFAEAGEVPDAVSRELPGAAAETFPEMIPPDPPRQLLPAWIKELVN